MGRIRILLTCPNQRELVFILPDFNLDTECIEGHDLSMTITGPNNIIALNTYEVTITNHGPDDYVSEGDPAFLLYDDQGNQIQEPFPDGCVISARLNCTIPSLMVNEEITLQFIQQIKPEPRLNFCLQVVNLGGAEHTVIPPLFPNIGPNGGCIHFIGTD